MPYLSSVSSQKDPIYGISCKSFFLCRSSLNLGWDELPALPRSLFMGYVFALITDLHSWHWWHQSWDLLNVWLAKWRSLFMGLSVECSPRNELIPTWLVPSYGIRFLSWDYVYGSEVLKNRFWAVYNRFHRAFRIGLIPFLGAFVARQHFVRFLKNSGFETSHNYRPIFLCKCSLLVLAFI